MSEMLAIPFIQKAILLCLLVGTFFAYVGVYVVLRRIVFVSIALSQMAACGFAFGLLAGFHAPFSALLFTFAGVLVFSLLGSEKRLTRESLIGFMYVLFSSLGVIFLAKSHQGEGGLLEMVSGNILTIPGRELVLVAALFTGGALLHGLFYRKFMFVFFDGETARTQGIAAGWWNFLFYLILGVMIAASIRVTGVLLSFAYIILPAMTALLISQRIRTIFVIAILCAGAATISGMYASFIWDLPSGVTNAAVLCLLFMVVSAGKALLRAA